MVMAEAVINRLWLRVRRFGDGGQEPIGRMGIINMGLKRNTAGRQEGKIMSDSAVPKENRNILNIMSTVRVGKYLIYGSS